MIPGSFNDLISLVEGKISRKQTRIRKEISPAKEACIVTRFALTKDTKQSLLFVFLLDLL